MQPSFTNFFKEQKSSSSFKASYTWKSPSNIALVKYWGKKEGIQLPANPSLSMTLENCHTITRLDVASKGSGNVEFFYGQTLKKDFLPKIHKLLERISPEFPDLLSFNYVIHSENTFPHSTGIASSASGFSALALCFFEFACSLYQVDLDQESFLKGASHWARLGSGSACRSLYEGFSLWGDFESLGFDGSDLYARPVKTSPFWKSFCDTILVVSKKEKSVSSRAGHALMNDHVFSESRYKVAKENTIKALEYLEAESWPELGEIVEQEAFMLHSLMMTAKKPFLLIEPETLSLINETRKFRERSNVPVYFTLDAGPNLHLLYPLSYDQEVRSWIESLKDTHLYQSIIFDRCGNGATSLE